MSRFAQLFFVSTLFLSAQACGPSTGEEPTPSEEGDGGPTDAGPADAGEDAGDDEAGVPEDAGDDAGSIDSGAPDSGAPDSGAPDSGVIDSGPPDSGVIDGGVIDGGVIDSGAPDSGVIDGGVLDGGVLDSGVIDSGAPDAGDGDSGAPDGGAGDDDAGQPVDGGCVADGGCIPVCGDGRVTADEECDDGNLVDGDGCDASCVYEAPLGWTCLAVYWHDNVCDCGCGIVDVSCEDAIASSCQFNGCPLDHYPVGDDNASCAVPVCGDGVQARIEACDDGNNQGGDGCAADCSFVEDGFACPLQGTCDPALLEVEPNDDGALEIGGFSVEGNDFSMANAGPPVTETTVVQAALDPAGDEDVFAVQNPGTEPAAFRAQTFGRWGLFQYYFEGETLYRTCPGNTGINIYDASGTLLVSNNDFAGHACSRAEVEIPPGETVYVHVTEFFDNDPIERYFVLLELN